jgi:hypothetical protein
VEIVSFSFLENGSGPAKFRASILAEIGSSQFDLRPVRDLRDDHTPPLSRVREQVCFFSCAAVVAVPNMIHSISAGTFRALRECKSFHLDNLIVIR